MNIYSTCSWLQQNGELTFDILLETSYDDISLKASKYPDIRSSNKANIRKPKTNIHCSPNVYIQRNPVERNHRDGPVGHKIYTRN